MIDPRAFSELRLETFFPDWLPRGRKLCLFDAEYWDGLWHEDKVPGVSFLFPAADRKKLGVVTLVHPFEESSAPRSVLLPDPAEIRLNALRVLDVLDIPIRFGDGPARVKRLADGRKMKSYRIRESKASQLSFQCGRSGEFRFLGVFGRGEGLGQLELARLDLVRANKK